MPGSRRVGLPREAGEHRAAPERPPALAAPVNRRGVESVAGQQSHPGLEATFGAEPMTAKDPVNILLVDDQPGKLLAYEAMLHPLGENLIRANSGREALEQLL